MNEVKLRVKRSIIPGREPGLLSLGELAVNVPDKKIWIGNGTENVLVNSIGADLEEAIQDLLNTTFVAGSNVVIDYEDTENQLMISVPDENIQDVIANTLVAGDNIMITYSDVDNEITIDGISSTWTDSTTTTATDVYGIPAGSSLVGLSAIEILEQILYPYQAATILSFSMSNTSTQYEIGATSGNPLFSWSFGNVSNVATLTLQYTRSGDGSLPAGTKTPSIASPTTNYNPALGGLLSNNIGAYITFTLTATQANNQYSNAVSNSTSISWWSKAYWGKSTNGALSAYSSLNGGSPSSTLVTSNSSYSFNVSASGSGYIYIFFEQSYDMSSILLGPTDVTSTFSQIGTQTIANAFGTNVTYKVWRSTNQLGGSDTYTVTIN